MPNEPKCHATQTITFGENNCYTISGDTDVKKSGKNKHCWFQIEGSGFTGDITIQWDNRKNNGWPEDKTLQQDQKTRRWPTQGPKHATYTYSLIDSNGNTLKECTDGGLGGELPSMTVDP